MTRFLIAMVFVVYLPACSDSCNGHLKYGKPSHADKILCREGYAIGYSYHYKNPVWTAYKLTKETISSRSQEKYEFYFDEDIAEAHRPDIYDYRGSGFWFSRMATDNAGTTPQALEETFKLSNTTLQLGGFTGTWWRRLEEYEKKLVSEHGVVYVVTGPVFDGVNRTVGKNNVAIASHFYKVFYLPTSKQMSGIVVPHKNKEKGGLEKYASSVDHIEDFTDLNFFHKILNIEEDEQEARKHFL